MGLIPKFSVIEQPLGLSAVFDDLTGDYSADNPGGWNVTVNPDKTSVSAATLDIYFPDPTTGIPDETTSTSTQINLLLKGYPVTDPIILVPSDFLDTGQIDDGVYLFKLTITTSSTTDPPIETEYDAVYYYGVFYKRLECSCADALMNPGCSCSGKNGMPSPGEVKILKIRAALYTLATNERNCQDVEKMAKTLKYVQELCAGTCKDCGC